MNFVPCLLFIYPNAEHLMPKKITFPHYFYFKITYFLEVRMFLGITHQWKILAFFISPSSADTARYCKH